MTATVAAEPLCLVAVRHPRTQSFCHAVAHRVAFQMAAKGWQVELGNPDVEPLADVLEAADAVVVVHPDGCDPLPEPPREPARLVVLHVSAGGMPPRPSPPWARDVVRRTFGPVTGSSPEARARWLDELDDLLPTPP